MKHKISQLYALEQLAGGASWIHRRHPVVKLIGTVAYLMTVVSFDRYALGRLVPYILYPVVLMASADLPYGMLFKRLMAALPFCLLAGFTNMLFDRTVVGTLAGVPVTQGGISMCVILLRTGMCVMAVFILISVTPFRDLAEGMRRLRVPGLFVILFEMTYRYLGVLVNEAYSMYLAYSLRNGGGSGIAVKDMGSFVGQLLLRSFDRAERIYNAMQCRGYPKENDAGDRERKRLKMGDGIYLTVVCAFCLFFRLVDGSL